MHAAYALFFLVALLSAIASANAGDHGVHHARSRIHRRMNRIQEIQRREAAPAPIVTSTPKRSLKRRSCAPRANNASVESTQSSSVIIISSTAESSAIASSSVKASSTLSPAKASSTSKSASTSSSASASTSTSTSTSSGSSTGSGSSSGTCSLSQLFPAGQGSKQWTTCSASNDALSLSDATLKPTNLISSLTHKFLAAPDDSTDDAMQAHYPAGSYIPSQSPRGGISFYASGPSSVDLSTAKEATLSYRVFFPDGFEFNKGGKLPGLYGGNSASESISCSGGSRSDNCMSARFMWRTDGKGEMYTYLPPSYSANDAVCDVAPFSECNPTYGASVGRGSFTFATGEWTTIGERVRLNDVGKQNGELELFANGKSMFSVSGLVLRNSDAGRLRGIMMQTFFGGSTSDWASPKDQDVYFADFSAAITEEL